MFLPLWVLLCAVRHAVRVEETQQLLLGDRLTLCIREHVATRAVYLKPVMLSCADNENLENSLFKNMLFTVLFKTMVSRNKLSKRTTRFLWRKLQVY